MNAPRTDSHIRYRSIQIELIDVLIDSCAAVVARTNAENVTTTAPIRPTTISSLQTIWCRRRLHVFRLSVRAGGRAWLSLLARYLTKRSWEFNQIYNWGAVWDRDELFRFWGQKVKSQGHNETKYESLFDEFWRGTRLTDGQTDMVQSAVRHSTESNQFPSCLCSSLLYAILTTYRLNVLNLTGSGLSQFRGLRSDPQCTSVSSFNTIGQCLAELLMIWQIFHCMVCRRGRRKQTPSGSQRCVDKLYQIW